MFPFYLSKFPEVAKSHLAYRIKRLPQARAYAKENGYQGAMYPWQTSDTGNEETQVVHYNPVSGTSVTARVVCVLHSPKHRVWTACWRGNRSNASP